MWVILGICSALALGVYDLAKKIALKENAVLAVLFIANIAGLLTLVPLIAAVHAFPDWAVSWGIHWQVLSWSEHSHVFLKAVIVNTSWVFAYVALKHLPLSIVAPIRASGPVWTLLGALILFAERPNAMQWLGLLVIIGSYFFFSLVGQKEGIHFKRNKWIWCIVAATAIGTISTLYDKYLIVNLGIDPFTLQAWFALYLVIIMGFITGFWWWPRRAEKPFRWSWWIPAIGALLIVADLVYFRAITDPDALIVILSALRRSSVVVSFALGAWIFSEHNPKAKAIALGGVLVGVLCILFAE